MVLKHLQQPQDPPASTTKSETNRVTGKKPWRTPSLKVFGTLAQITAGIVHGGVGDGTSASASAC